MRRTANDTINFAHRLEISFPYQTVDFVLTKGLNDHQNFHKGKREVKEGKMAM